MINVSNEFARAIAQNTKTEFKATLTLADGTVRELVGGDVMLGAPSFTDATSSMSSFDVGAAVIGQFGVRLNNYSGDFDQYDFTGAEIAPYVGVRLSDGTVEWVRKGRYLVDQPRTYGTVISLTCLDLMSRFERTYDDVSTRYPATLQTIVADICAACDVPMESALFDNCKYVVQERPEDGLTCLAMLAYACQVAGCFARMTNVGTLRVAWYDTEAFEGEDWLDGEYFDDASPYASGDTADGGNFIDYTSGDAYDGGSIARRTWANIHAFSSMSIVTDDVVVTGVRVTAQDDKPEDEGGTGQEGETTLWGSGGYVIDISDNPLIAFGRSAEVAAQVGARVVGMRFRPLDVSALGDPTIEAGDPIVVTDRKQNSYRSYITSLTYKAGAYAAVSCGAETPSRNSARSFSAITRAIVEARRAVRDERTDRVRAVEQLARELGESSGLYMTSQRQEDGSYIYYMHDKPKLDESAVVWKLTANALGISTDGGETYPYGLDVSGDAILNRVYAIGIDADHITTGALTVKRNGTTVFSADVDTGQVYMSGDCVSIGAESLTTAIGGVRALYGTCTTSSWVAAKSVACEGFVLRTGAVVNVRFTYKNTASSPTLNVNGTGAKPIYINNAAMTSEYYWNAQDVVTFVYSGSYWYVADGGALSKIKVTADSISLSVSNAALGSKASITLSVDGTTQTKTIDMTGVRNAFKDDTTAITISAGTVTFNSNTFVVNSTNFSVTSTGVITATSGTIGGFTIGSKSLYNGTSSMSSTTKGVYLGTDGLFVNGSNHQFSVSVSMGVTMKVATVQYITMDSDHNNMLVVGNGGVFTNGKRGASTGAVKIPISVGSDGILDTWTTLYLRNGLLCTS